MTYRLYRLKEKCYSFIVIIIIFYVVVWFCFVGEYMRPTGRGGGGG